MLINLTPHRINVFVDLDDCGDLVLEPSGQIARVNVQNEKFMEMDGIPIMRQKVGEVIGLPEPIPGVVYIVSTIVAMAMKGKGRYDIVAPGELVRDGEGKPIGCYGLTRH